MEEQKTERTYKVVFSNLIQKLEEDKTTTKERVRLAHITEAKGTRVVTMAYKWYRDGRVEYGATIWRKSKPEESYTKEMRRASNETATERLGKCPVVLFVEPLTTKNKQVQRLIRNMIGRLGVRAYSRKEETPTHYVCETGETPLIAFNKTLEKFNIPYDKEGAYIIEFGKWVGKSYPRSKLRFHSVTIEENYCEYKMVPQ